MLKLADKKLEKLGFKKTEENEYCSTWERYNEKFKYTQVVDFMNKKVGGIALASYDKELFDSKRIGNTCVALTHEETKACVRKMKELKKEWRDK